MPIDTVIKVSDSAIINSATNSILHINHNIRLQLPTEPPKGFFGIPNTTLIPILITILIFASGHFLQWRSKKLDRLKKLRSLKEVVLGWIKLAEDPIKLQIKNIEIFRKQLLEKELIGGVSFFKESFLIDKLEGTNLNELVDLMVLNHTGTKSLNESNLLNIISHTRRLNQAENYLLSKYNEYLNFTIEERNKWNSLWGQLNVVLFKMKSQSQNKSIEDNRIKFYLKILSIKDASISMQMLSSMRDVCETYFCDNEDKLTEELYTVINKLLFLNTQWISFSKGVCSYFETAEKTIEATYKILINSVGYFERTELKHWCKIQ